MARATFFFTTSRLNVSTNIRFVAQKVLKTKFLRNHYSIDRFQLTDIFGIGTLVILRRESVEIQGLVTLFYLLRFELIKPPLNFALSLIKS